jgi:asparagine synthase (glutamine-hydrolysing)
LHASPPEAFRALQGAQGVTVLQKLTMADFGSYLPDDILVKVDRASMLNSLEVRAPFLDHRIISFAFGRVPDDWRATPSARKILLRRLAGRVLPHELDVTRKQGFSIPLSAWFKGEWGGYMEDVMLNADQPTFNRRAVAKLVAGQRRGLANSQRLFAITMFELWRREYGMEMPG